MSTASSAQQHYFVLANNYERRALLENLVKKNRPNATVKVFAHPSAMKEFLETQRDEGVSLSSPEQAHTVISDRLLPNIKPEDEPEYNHFQGTKNVLDEFTNYFDNVALLEISKFDTSDPYEEPDFSSVKKSLNFN